MYEAMQAAVLGDDVLGDDPTVSELEALGAKTVGKEAALFVPSGTMGNQIALACWVERGDAILVEEEAHIAYYEVGGPAILAGAMSWTLPSTLGVIDPSTVEARALSRDLHTPETSLLCLENTHNRAGGTVIPLATMAAYRSVADEKGMRIHLDGARVFNAAVALGVPAREVCKDVDSVNFCLSKGLRAPVGSLLCGPSEFIERARRWRKRLGGGMRQAGLLAACGIVSLTKMVDRLAEDHRRCREMALALAELPGLEIDWDRVQTNILRVGCDAPSLEWQSRMANRGVHFFPVGQNRFRLVFHADITDTALGEAIDAFRAESSVLA
jgi:threonine aldolase